MTDEEVKKLLEEIEENKELFNNFKIEEFNSKRNEEERIIDTCEYKIEIKENKIIINANMEIKINTKNGRKLIRKAIKQKNSPLAIKIKENIKRKYDEAMERGYKDF